MTFPVLALNRSVANCDNNQGTGRSRSGLASTYSSLAVQYKVEAGSPEGTLALAWRAEQAKPTPLLWWRNKDTLAERHAT